MTGIPIAVGELVDTPTLNTLARAYLRKRTAKQVVNTTTATDLLNGEFSIPAGALSTNRFLLLTARGDWIQNSGAATKLPRIYLDMGGVTLIDTGVPASSVVGAIGARWGWLLEAKITNLDATNSQWTDLKFELVHLQNGSTVDNAGFTTGEGRYGVLDSGSNIPLKSEATGGNATSVDTTVACALALNVILPVASASLDMTLKAADGIFF